VIDLARIAGEASSAAEAAKALRAATHSPIEAIKAFRVARHVSLGEAKEAIMSSPSWAAEAAAHDAFLQSIQDEWDAAYAANSAHAPPLATSGLNRS
jgi:ribosomal protein L7/L12